MLTAALLGLLCGTALQLQLAQVLTSAAMLALSALTVLLLIAIKIATAPASFSASNAYRALKNGLFFCLFACLAFLATNWRASERLAHNLPDGLIRQDLTLEGRIADLPQQRGADVQFVLAVDKAERDGQHAQVPPRLALSWYANQHVKTLADDDAADDEAATQQPTLQAGQRWRLQVRLKPVHGNINPHGFDYELWMFERNIRATGYVRGAALLTPAPQGLAQLYPANWASSVARLRAHVRQQIAQRVSEPRIAGVLAALVMGEQSAIERSDWELFRATGVAHLMSISGLHITLFAYLAFKLINLLWRRSIRLLYWQPAQYAAWVGGVLLAGAYAVFTGWGVPAQRTVLMLLVACVLRLSGKQWPWRVQLLLAAAVVVAWDPWALMQAGFWLSFVAVGVLMLGTNAQPIMAQANDERADAVAALDSITPPTRWQKLTRPIVKFVQEQARISLALAPLSLLLFNQFSLVGVLANFVAIPLVTFIVTPLALLGMLFHALWPLAAWFLSALIALLQWCNTLPHAVLYSAAPPFWLGVAGVVGAVWMLLPKAWYWRLSGLPFVLAVLFYQPTRPPDGEFEATAIDIGQGSAVLIRTASHSMLFDAGPKYSEQSNAGVRTIVPLLRALGEAPQTIVISHQDSDHSGGAASILQTLPHAQVLTSMPAQADWPASVQVTRCATGQSWAWDGVRFDMLHPLPDDYARNFSTNAMSCVLRISNVSGMQSVLLTGDIPALQEQLLVERTPPEQLRSSVLLAPHHGSKTSSSTAFLQSVNPQQIWLQAGYLNRYQHPANEVLARYAQTPARLWGNAECGALRWASNKPAQTDCLRRNKRRYWWHQIAP